MSRLRDLIQNRPKDRPQMPTSGSQALLLDDLQDDFVLQKLELMSITKLLRLEGINHQRLQHLVRRTLSKRRGLLLIIGRQLWAYAKYKKNVIVLSSLSMDTVEELLGLLPNITSLWLVVTVKIKDLEPITLLLGRLSTQLTVLRLDFKEAQLSPKLSLQPLIAALNRMDHLRTVYCHIERLLTPKEKPHHLQLHFLRQLQSFDLTTLYNGDVIFAEVLNQMAATETPPLVHLCIALREDPSLPRLLNMDPRIAERFRSLGLHTLEPLTTAQMTLICERLRHLNNLSIGSPYLTTRQMASAIAAAKLPQLTSLTWFAHFRIRQMYRTNQRYLARFADAIEPDEVAEVDKLPQLTTITHLDLLVHIVRHDDLALFHLKRIFPSLTSLDVWIRSCDQCGILMEEDINTKRRKRCLLSTATYWRDLPLLQQVTSQQMDLTEAEWRSMVEAEADDVAIAKVSSNWRLCDFRLCKAFKGIYKKLASWICGCCDGRRR